MLEVYKDKQSLFYQEIKNSIDNNKISHAYLIETNDYIESDDLILAFIKELFKLTVRDNDEFINISTLIDNDTFSDFIRIEAINGIIKKEQILDLKDKFMTSSITNRPRIYLIKDGDKLNKYAANALLKFLEEPDGNIIAIITTNNRYKVLETIRSRCQLYSLVGTIKNEDDIDLELYNTIIETLEKYNCEAIAYLPINLKEEIKDKEIWIKIFKYMITVYEKSLRKKENINDINDTIVDMIVSNNSVDRIIHKMNILFTTLNNLEYNLNINMMLDKFIIEFTGGE